MEQSTFIQQASTEKNKVSKSAALQEPRVIRYALTFIALAFLAFFLVLPLQPFKKVLMFTWQLSHIQMH